MFRFDPMQFSASTTLVVVSLVFYTNPSSIVNGLPLNRLPERKHYSIARTALSTQAFSSRAHAYFIFDLAKSVCNQTNNFILFKVLQEPIKYFKNSEIKLGELVECRHIAWKRNEDLKNAPQGNQNQNRNLKSVFTVEQCNKKTSLIHNELHPQINENSIESFVGEFGPFFEGDVVLNGSESKNPVKRQAVKNSTALHVLHWPDGIIHYQFANDYDPEAKRIILEVCMRMISEHTCITFVERPPGHRSYVEFVEDDPNRCWSEGVGRLGRKQKLNLPLRCLRNVGTGTHEILHALGFWHEQSRPDRDNYLTVNKNNIVTNALQNYEIEDMPFRIDSFGSFYDFDSVMHYPAINGFSRYDSNGNRLATFTPKKFIAPWFKHENIGQRTALSHQDIYQLQRLYNCCGIAWNYNTSAIAIFSTNDEFLINEDIHGNDYDPGEFGEHFEGDMLNNPRDIPLVRARVGVDPERIWPYGVIGYRFANNVEMLLRSRIRQAMEEIELKTCLQFIERKFTWKDAYVHITVNKPGCFANVGYNRTHKRHILNLNPKGCIAKGLGVIIHELLHIIGMYHEHVKPGRDRWIKINLDNVRADKRHDFEELKTEHPWTLGWPVNYDSIMMPPKNFYAKDSSLVTIEASENAQNIRFGQRVKMSPEDIAQILHMYNCCAKHKKQIPKKTLEA